MNASARRPIAWTLAVLSTLGALGACGSPAKTAAADDLVVGTLYPTRGSQRVGGQDEFRGVELAAQWVNDHGGVRGRPVKLHVEGVGVPEEVPAAISDLRAAGAVAIIGSHGSSFSAIAASAVATRGPVVFETGAVGELQPSARPGSTFFRLAPMGASLGRAAIRFVADQLVVARNVDRTLRYGVVRVDDPYGRSVGNGAIEEVRKRDLPLVFDEHYSTFDADYDAIAQRIGAARVDVLFVAAYLDDAIALRRALLRWHVKLFAAIGTSSSFCMPAFGRRLGKAAVGLFASDKPDAAHMKLDSLRPDARDALSWAIDEYRRRWHDVMSAPALSGFSHGLAVLGTVLPAAKTFDVSGISTAAVHARLPLGALPNGAGLDLAPAGAFDAGQNRRADSVIEQWVSPTSMPVVWPASAATDPILPIDPA